MTITLPLQPQEEAQLLAAAHARGVPPEAIVDSVVKEVLSRMTAESQPDAPRRPTRSAWGLLAKYGPAPSEEEIDQNRAEMLANFPRDDF